MTEMTSLQVKCYKRLPIVAAVGVLFGVVTLITGWRVLFGGMAEQLALGDVALRIVWFNFIAGFAYLIAGFGLFRRAPWAAQLAAGIVGVTVLAAAAFAVHKLSEGSYEMRTVWAFALRAGVWLAIAWTARQALLKRA